MRRIRTVPRKALVVAVPLQGSCMLLRRACYRLPPRLHRQRCFRSRSALVVDATCLHALMFIDATSLQVVLLNGCARYLWCSLFPSTTLRQSRSHFQPLKLYQSSPAGCGVSWATSTKARRTSLASTAFPRALPATLLMSRLLCRCIVAMAAYHLAHSCTQQMHTPLSR